MRAPGSYGLHLMHILKKRNAEPATEEEQAEQRADRSVLALLLAIKLQVLPFGPIAYTILQNKTLGGFFGWLAVWNQWDSQHYQDVAHYGYVREGDQAPWIVFFPLFPWLVRVFAILFRDYLLSAFVVSTLSSIAVVLLLRWLAELDVDRVVANNAVWFMLIFPTVTSCTLVTRRALSWPSRSGVFWPHDAANGGSQV